MINPIVSYITITIIVFSIPVFLLRYGRQYLVALMPIYLITGNVFAESFFTILGVTQSLAVPIYCATFLVSNIVSEFYGKQEAKRAVLVGFLGQLVFVVAMILITHSNILPSSLENFQQTFKILPRLILASMVAYLASQLLDVLFYNMIRRKTGEKMLYVRNSFSTWIAQFIDTTLLVVIAFWGVAPFDTWGKMATFIVSTWLFKVAVGFFDNIFIYLAKGLYSKQTT